MSPSRILSLASRVRSLTSTYIIAFLCFTGCDPGESDDSTIVIVSGGEDMSSPPTGSGDMSSPMPSMDARCMNQTCSGKGVCQILAESPICVCQEGYQAEGLTCEEVPVGAPQITALSQETVRLSEGESVTLTLEVKHEGEAEAVLRYVDPDDPTLIEDLYSFESEGSGVFTLALSWQAFNELLGIDFEDEPLEEVLEVYVEDGEGRSAKRPLLLQLHCDGKGGSACDGSCVNLATSVEHCGACYRNTPQGASCTQGERLCDNPSLVACDDACVTSDDMNCGRCGNICEGGASCQEGEGVCYVLDVYEDTGDSANFVKAYEPANQSPALLVDSLGQVHHIAQFSDPDVSWGGSQTSAFAYITRSPSEQNWREQDAPPYPQGKFVYGQTLLTSDDKLVLFYLASPSQGEDAHLYTTAKEGLFGPWQEAKQVSTSPIPVLSFGGRGFQISTDAYGMHHLVYRTRTGFEIYSSREGDGGWQAVGVFEQAFGHPGISSRFGHVYDVKRGIHHVVSRDEINLYHLQVDQSGALIQSDVIDQGTFHRAETISKLYLDTQDVLHVMYGKREELISRSYSLLQRTWTQPEIIIPASSDRNYPVAHTPDPDTFTLDSQGNVWVLLHYGWLTVLLSKQKGDALWSSRLISSAFAGEDAYLSSRHALAVYENWSGTSIHTFHMDYGTRYGSRLFYSRSSY